MHKARLIRRKEDTLLRRRVKKSMKLATKMASKKVNRKIVLMLVLMASMMGTFAVVGSCEPTPAPEAPSLNINFDIEEMFTWAQTIINAMLPVVYIIMGVALGFLIIRAFKAAFN